MKPNGVVHWVSAAQGVPVKINEYGRLFRVPAPSADTFLEDINPESLVTLNGFVEPAIVAHESERFQFERVGYFCKDSQHADQFNKTVSLREGF